MCAMQAYLVKYLMTLAEQDKGQRDNWQVDNKAAQVNGGQPSKNLPASGEKKKGARQNIFFVDVSSANKLNRSKL